MNTRIFHLHALSALHVGTGQGIGAVDLPIARSRATNLPLVPGSALKGVLRDEAKEKWHLNQDDIQALFGADSQADKENIHVIPTSQLSHNVFQSLVGKEKTSVTLHALLAGIYF